MLMFFNFLTFIFFIHITSTVSIFCLLIDFIHFMIIIKIWSIDEISFIHNNSIYLSLFFYLNLWISEENSLHECLISFRNI